MNVLLIIDPQNDFISGSLPAPHADKTMNGLCDWILQPDKPYDAIVVTMDQHPIDHCSFVDHGREWPRHCVRYSSGAAIYPPLMEVLCRIKSEGYPLHFIEKATTVDKDAYSAFEKEVPSVLREADHIYVAGIAGDFCVRCSVADLERHGLGDKLELLEDYIPYINPQK